MNSASHSAAPYRLTRVALWALGIACAVAWLAAVVTELQRRRDRALNRARTASGPTGQPAAPSNAGRRHVRELWAPRSAGPPVRIDQPFWSNRHGLYP